MHSNRKIRYLGVPAFTTATPPIAAFGSSYNVLRQVANATRSSCRRRRPIAQQSQNQIPRCVSIYDGYAESQTFTVAAAAGCDLARSGRKIRYLGVSGFTTATPPIAAFGSSYNVLRQVANVPRSSCRRRRPIAQQSQNQIPRCVSIYDGYAADRSLRQRLQRAASSRKRYP